MTTPSNALPESSLDVQAIATRGPCPLPSRFLWSVRARICGRRTVPSILRRLAAAGAWQCWDFFMGLVFGCPHSVHRNGRDGPGGAVFLMEVMPYGHTGWLPPDDGVRGRGGSTRSTRFMARRARAGRSQHPVLENRLPVSGPSQPCFSKASIPLVVFCRCFVVVIAVVTHLVMVLISTAVLLLRRYQFP